MITARPTRLGRWFWGTFSRLSLRWGFREVVLEGEVVPDPARATLLVGNHISWWDGFWPLYLNDRHLHKAYYVMMLEEQLRQRPFMRQGGAFSIQPGSRSIVDSLAYAQQLLADPAHLVLVFPQGRIHSLYERDIRFARGIDRLWDPERVQLVLAAAFPDYFSHPRPALYCYWETCTSGGSLEAAYRDFYQRCRARQAAKTS